MSFQDIWFPEFELVRPEDVLNNVKAQAHFQAYKVLKELSNTNRNLQVATAESLTGGLIFSTLVDIPYAGANKYGCFSVYDTDAKRIFLGVKVEDVYTHRCAAEMAIGVLKNSNASFAIAVSGNAMPYQGLTAEKDEVNRLGEVFIGIACYNKEGQIIVKTKVINMCEVDDKNTINSFKICVDWFYKVSNDQKLLSHYTEIMNHYKEIQDSSKSIGSLLSRGNSDSKLLKTKSKKSKLPITHTAEQISQHFSGYNPFIITSLISNIIRFKTTEEAFKFAIEFLKENKRLIDVPLFLSHDKINSDEDKISMKLIEASNNLVLLDSERNKSEKKVNFLNKEARDYHTRDGENSTKPLSVVGGKSKKKNK